MTATSTIKLSKAARYCREREGERESEEKRRERGKTEEMTQIAERKIRTQRWISLSHWKKRPETPEITKIQNNNNNNNKTLNEFMNILLPTVHL